MDAPVLSQLMLTLDANGQVEMKVNGQGGIILLGLLEQGKQMVFDMQKKAAEGSAVEVAPPGLVNRLNGRGH